jgi:hypothetical protein
VVYKMTIRARLLPETFLDRAWEKGKADADAGK